MRKLAQGFTLIELLVVISIIGLLATLLAANLNSARSRARDAERKSDLKNISTALRLYYNDSATYNSGSQTFPRSDSSGKIKACAAGASTCDWGQPWAVGSVTYMNTLPKDPLSTQNYLYVYSPFSSSPQQPDTFSLTACLENKSDSSGISISSAIPATVAGLTCSTGWVFQVLQQ